MSYETGMIYKTSEEHNYEHGIIGEQSHYSMTKEVSLSRETLPDLLAAFAAFCGVKASDLTIDDDTNFISAELLENHTDLPASNDELERWKAGKVTLYRVRYETEVYQVAREQVNAAVFHASIKD